MMQISAEFWKRYIQCNKVTIVITYETILYYTLKIFSSMTDLHNSAHRWENTQTS